MVKFNFDSLGEKPEEKKEIPEIKTIPEKSLEKLQVIDQTKKAFDVNEIFTNLANTSEFKRLIYKAIVGVVHRGSKEDLDKKLSKALKQVRTK